MVSKCLLTACLWIGFASATWAEQEPAEFFETNIRPVLVRSCLRCHGPQTSEQEFRVDSREALLQGGASGPAIVPGRPESSLLLQAMDADHDELQMPPDDPLPERVVRDFRQWITNGAVWPEAVRLSAAGDHWAFQPVRPVDLPEAGAGWSEHPIDRFIAAGWRDQGLHPVAEAAPGVLLRRLSFDLTGLPPTPAEQQAFAAEWERNPDSAYDRLIERLLASPQYGERWGRHWMDVVRYADTAGDNADYPIPEARRYRDYIIDACNADLPYDQFVREQLAGDLLARRGEGTRYAEQVAATGFLALSRRYGTAPYELWHLTLEDTIDTVGRAFLGITLRCARCHDHKFDPVATEDYYALYGIFDSTRFPWAGGEEFQSKQTHRLHFVPLVPQSVAAGQQQAFAERLQELDDQIGGLEQRLQGTVPEGEKGDLQQTLDALRNERFLLQRSSLPPDVPGGYAVWEGTPHDVAVQLAGDPGKAGPPVSRGAIGFLRDGPLEIPNDQSGRLQLAEWLTDGSHPLTARVMVNRIWQQHFGRGIVETPSNFGLSGAPPTHPELLDYLAAEFVRSGWSVKHMHRLIFSSRTWRLAADDDSANAAVDTGNRYYWRHDRRRLEAEAIRDAMLSVNGQLQMERPGPHPFPPIADWHWTQHNQFKECYDSRHRSVYLMTQRIQRHPFLALFDGPDTNTTTARRTTATVTPQALYLMNSPEMAAAAAALAERLMGTETADAERIAFAYRLCYAREVTDREAARDDAYLREFAAAAAAMGREAAAAERDAWTSYARILLSANEFFYLD